MKNLKELVDRQLDKEAVPVLITGTTFGNTLQNRIITLELIQNWLLFYLCTFVTYRYFMKGL